MSETQEEPANRRKRERQIQRFFKDKLVDSGKRVRRCRDIVKHAAIDLSEAINIDNDLRACIREMCAKGGHMGESGERGLEYYLERDGGHSCKAYHGYRCRFCGAELSPAEGRAFLENEK